MICPECQQPFKVKRYGQSWCSTKCSKLADQRELKRARTIYRAIYGAATAKKSDPNRNRDLTFVMREVRSWAKEDREAGRLGPPRHRHEADRGHQRARSC